MQSNTASRCSAVALFVISVLSSAAAMRIILEDLDREQIEIRVIEDVCGVPPIKPDIGDTAQNIIGGKEAIPHSWPWQVEMKLDGDFYCGGSIYGSRFVLIAAQCLMGQSKPWSPEQVQVTVGQHDRTKPEPLKKTFQAKALHVHPKFSWKTFENDIGVIELDTDIEFNEHTQPICLPTVDPKPGTLCAATGWGMDRWPPHSVKGLFGDEGTDKLMEVALPIVSQSECAKSYNSSDFPKVTDSMICAGYPQGGKGACVGDGGGPLACHGPDGLWRLVGITSWAKPFALPNFPTVFTRVLSFVDWFNSVMTR